MSLNPVFFLTRYSIQFEKRELLRSEMFRKNQIDF